MPCNDVTERLELRLDAEDRIDSFRLQKNTCGAPVGNALLLTFIKGRTTADLLQGTLLGFVPDVYQARTLDQFLLNKQFYAVQACIAAFVGVDGAGNEDLFTIEQIEYGEDGTRIEGLIKIELVTEKIRACGNCCHG